MQLILITNINPCVEWKEPNKISYLDIEKIPEYLKNIINTYIHKSIRQIDIYYDNCIHNSFEYNCDISLQDFKEIWPNFNYDNNSELLDLLLNNPLKPINEIIEHPIVFFINIIVCN